MDDKTKTDIEAGVPMVIAHWDKDGNVTSQETYNLENISLSDWQKEQLARATLEACRTFYSDPENVKKYEACCAEFTQHFIPAYAAAYQEGLSRARSFADR